MKNYSHFHLVFPSPSPSSILLYPPHYSILNLLIVEALLVLTGLDRITESQFSSNLPSKPPCSDPLFSVSGLKLVAEIVFNTFRIKKEERRQEGRKINKVGRIGEKKEREGGKRDERRVSEMKEL